MASSEKWFSIENQSKYWNITTIEDLQEKEKVAKKTQKGATGNLRGISGVTSPKSHVKKVSQLYKGGIDVVKYCCSLSKM